MNGLPRPVRWLLLAVLGAVILVVLFTTVFPWVERTLSDPTMGMATAPLGTLLS